MKLNAGGKAFFLAGSGGILKSSRKREFKELGVEHVQQGKRQPDRPVQNA